VAALRGDIEQVDVEQAGEMDAGSRWRDLGDCGELGAGAGVAVHEGIEHAGARGLADGGRDGSDDEIGMLWWAGVGWRRHALTLSEA
jgi:hypothetical protein